MYLLMLTRLQNQFSTPENPYQSLAAASGNGPIGERLAKSLHQAHSILIDRRYFWSDSKTALSWLSSKKRHRAFCLAEI